MFGRSEPRSVAERRADATREAIVEAAWALSKRKGLVGWTLRELAKELGLAAPTLYAYVDGKTAIYDAMFRAGYETFATETAAWAREVAGASARDALTRAAHRFVAFCTADPTRYQLMFQRVIPDFEPSDDAYAASLASYASFREGLAAMGVTDDGDLDLWTALMAGLTDQQISNDPGGDRWTRLVDRAVAMYCGHLHID